MLRVLAVAGGTSSQSRLVYAVYLSMCSKSDWQFYALIDVEVGRPDEAYTSRPERAGKLSRRVYFSAVRMRALFFL